MPILMGLIFFGVALSLNRQICRWLGLAPLSHTHDVLGITGVIIGTLTAMLAGIVMILR